AGLLSVSLEQGVQFTGPEGGPVSAPSGMYRVEKSGDDRLRLILAATGEAFVLQARTLMHKQRLEGPLALPIPRPDRTQHLAYLLRDGKGLVAVGTSGTVRERGLLTAPLTSDEVKIYVALKLDQSAKASPAPNPKQQAHDEALRTLLAVLRSQPGGPEMI